MSTRKLQLPISGFSDGLNTDASVLNVLPSEMMDGTVNVELFTNGSVRRRRGVDFIGTAPSGDFLSTIRTSIASDEAKQESPSSIYAKLTAPNGSLVERIIINIDNEFRVYEVTNPALRDFDNPLQTLVRTGHSLDAQKFYYLSMCQSGNRVYFTGLYCSPGYISVASDNTTLEITYLDAIVRNPSATVINARVSHNSKWYECIQTNVGATGVNEPGVGTDWEKFWFALQGAIPAGTAAWSNGVTYTSTLVKRYDKRVTVIGSDTFPTTVDFFAGRLWLAGDPKYPNEVIFSQVVTSGGTVERFMQVADPFQTADPNLVDSDGGIVSVQGAAIIKQLKAVSGSIFVGCTNGIWQIRGSNNVFKATDFSVNLTLQEGIDSPEAMVVANMVLMVFGQSSIWISNTNDNLSTISAGSASFKDVARNRVTDLYTSIPQASRAAGKAVYNITDQRVYYFFNTTRTTFDSSFNTHLQLGYSKNVLVIDTQFSTEVQTADRTSSKRATNGSFLMYELDDGAFAGMPYIACPFVSKDVPIADQEVYVVDDKVFVNGSEVLSPSEDTADYQILFIALQRVTSGSNIIIKGAFGKLEGSTIKDWSSSDDYAISFTSRIVAGVQTMGDVLHKKVATYIYFVFERIENGDIEADLTDSEQGGCFLRTAWQFSISSASAKYSAQIPIYVPHRYTYDYADDNNAGINHVWYKHRARGRGNVLQLIFENDGDKDFCLVGLAQQFYGVV